MTTLDIITAIANGEADEQLDQIVGVIQARRQALATIATSGLKRGDTVTFSSQISPRYLEGLPATVVSVNHTTITVSCPVDPEYGRFSGGRGIRCPKSLIAGAS